MISNDLNWTLDVGDKICPKSLPKLLQAVSSDRSLNNQKYKIAVNAME